MTDKQLRRLLRAYHIGQRDVEAQYKAVSEQAFAAGQASTERQQAEALAAEIAANERMNAEMERLKTDVARNDTLGRLVRAMPARSSLSCATDGTWIYSPAMFRSATGVDAATPEEALRTAGIEPT